MRGRRWAASAFAALFVLGGFATPTVAAAEQSSGVSPLWYLDAMKIPAIHGAGTNGAGVTIAVFDGALNPDIANFRGSDIEVRQLDGCPDPVLGAEDFEVSSHGTSVTSLVVGNGTSEIGPGPVGIAPGARILYYGVLQDACDANSVAAALDDAVAQGADIVTVSGGYGRLTDEFSQETVDSVSAALRDGVLVVAGLPNRGTATDFELMTMNGVVNVASVDSQAEPAKDFGGTDMRNEDVDVVAPGVDVAGLGWDGSWGMSTWSGNSAATPIVAGLLALAKERWPDATASQLLQSLIRNTGSEPHELQWSSRLGHGVVNATRVMAEDPGQYPDENPLFKDDQSPSFDQVYGSPETEASPSPSAETDTSVLPWAIGGAVILIGVIVVIVVQVSRRKAGGQRDV